MSHLPENGRLVQDYRGLHGSRFYYNLAPNDRADEAGYTAQSDPLNPSAVLETPGAPDESWFRRTPSARGTISPHDWDSTLLKGRRSIRVYTPPGYTASSGPYALLILFDGPAYVRAVGDDGFFRIGAPQTLDNLITAGLYENRGWASTPPADPGPYRESSSRRSTLPRCAARLFGDVPSDAVSLASAATRLPFTLDVAALDNDALDAPGAASRRVTLVAGLLAAFV